MNKYDDIINVTYTGPFNHQRMSLDKRAFEFLPFSALTGYNESLEEKRRLTVEEKELLNEDELNEKLSFLKNIIKETPLVIVTYFVKDKKKVGGNYLTVTDYIKKIDEIKKEIILNNQRISFKDLYDIKIENNLSKKDK